MLRVALIVATIATLGCPSHGPEPAHPIAIDDTAVRVRIAQAEARRAGGIAELHQLAQLGPSHARKLALRGLGRIGGADAIGDLEAELGDPDPDVAAAALGGLGVAASLDEPTDAVRDALGVRIAEAIPRCGTPCQAVGLEALGRAGGPAQEAALVAALADPHAAAVAALALGRYGRRKLALTADAEAALVHATASADRDVRYAAAYALARAVIGAPVNADDHAIAPSTAALAALIADPDPEIRATAIAGIARRKELIAARLPVERALADADWRVAVEAVRALAGDAGSDAGRATVAARLAAMLARAAQHDDAAAQILIEALRTLLAHPPTDGAALAAFAAAVAVPSPQLATLAPRTRGWIEALAFAAAAAADTDAAHAARFDLVQTADLPEHLLLGVAAELATRQDLATRRALLRRMLVHADARVRAAALPLLVTTWKDGDAADHHAIVATFAAAIDAPQPALSGAAVDAVAALYDAIGTAIGAAPERAGLDAAVIQRARRERDPELGAALVELIGKRAIVGGADACHAGLGGPPVLARAAAGCLEALGEGGEPPAIGAATAPPVDVARVIGARVRWHLATSRGEIAIELLPDVAPWNVATIVALTERGFYDGLEVHRVVPDFVVQGGDPTMSGEGGPGFTTPAEPATVLDGAGFVAGGIGMADAGRDSAGSQWFAMHSRAPHLDGRYTWVGQVVSGQNVADMLLIGDTVERATIELSR